MVTEIRCSSLHRPMNCLGFLSIENLLSQEAGQPAKDGTAVGELLSEMIRQQTPTPKIGTTASNGTFLDQDMWYHATETYNLLLQRAQGSRIETEERIDWMTPAGIKIRGSFDISYVVGDTLYIEDLKYGYGIVDVKDNWQLIGYTIGQMMRLRQMHNYAPSRIVMTIYQPRPHHEDGRVRSVEVDVATVNEYYKRICEQMHNYVHGDKTLATTKSCKYCEAAGVCPALNRAANKSLDVVLTNWSEKVLTNEEVAEQYELLERASELIELRLKSIEQLAISRLQANQIIPGYVYEMTYGDRKWKNNVTAESIKILTGVDVIKSDMMSPNQAEKAGVSKKLTQAFTEKPGKGSKLVKKDVTKEAKQILNKPY